ncbi:MAG: S1 RNA-binding domain-containing protein [Clostridia bacterium]
MEIEIGEIYDGKITGIMNFGAFVDFAENKKGMVHISEVSSTFVKEIKDFLSIGQDVKVKVVSISAEGKIALSMKKTEEPKAQTRNFRPDNNFKKEKPFRSAPRYKREEKAPAPSRPGDYEWQSSSQAGNFEDMMSKFKKNSEEKISDLKKFSEPKRGGHSRRER